MSCSLLLEHWKRPSRQLSALLTRGLSKPAIPAHGVALASRAMAAAVLLPRIIGSWMRAKVAAREHRIDDAGGAGGSEGS